MLRKLTLTYALCSLLGTAAEQQENPWAAFRPGSYAKYRATNQGTDTTMRFEFTVTLLSVEGQNTVVEQVVVMNGNETRKTIKSPLESPAPVPATGSYSPWIEKPITAAGKTFTCKCRDLEIKDDKGNVIVNTSCVNSQIPGSLVRSVMKMTGAVTLQTTAELIEFAAK